MMPFDLPPRTSSNLSLDSVLTPEMVAKLVSGEPLELQLPVELDQVEGYTCIDCGFTTADLETMNDHQSNQQRYHSWRERLKRWWATRGMKGPKVKLG